MNNDEYEKSLDVLKNNIAPILNANDEDDDFKKVSYLSNMFSVLPATIYAVIKRGRVVSKLVNNKHLISVKDYAEYVATKYSRKLSLFEGKPVFADDEMSPKEAIKLIKIKQTDFYYMLRNGLIKSYRKGGVYIIKRSDVDLFIQKKHGFIKKNIT